MTGGVREFWLPSRGDRARGRFIAGPDNAPDTPKVILAAPDGAASHAWIDSRFKAWSDAATLVALDLPLCGARTSEKLSAHGLDPAHPLSARIRGDLEEQLAADLSAIGAWLSGSGTLHFVGCGPHTAWFQAACERAGGFASVSVTRESDDAWHDDVLRTIRSA